VFGSVGMPELIIGLVVILLLFGAKRVPELARGLGSGVREFKKGTQEGEVENEKKEEEKKEEQLEASKSEHDDESKLEEDSSVEAEKAEQKRS
jgi:sec-independent protein translocase protein TatA